MKTLASIAAVFCAFAVTTSFAHDVTKEKEDHKSWTLDHDAWVKDHASWETDHKRAQAALKTLQMLVRQQGDALRKHEHEIKAHARAIAVHDKALDSAKSGHNEEALDKRHAADAAEHDRLRKAHDDSGKHHKELLEITEEIEKVGKEDSETKTIE